MAQLTTTRVVANNVCFRATAKVASTVEIGRNAAVRVMEDVRRPGALQNQILGRHQLLFSQAPVASNIHTLGYVYTNVYFQQ
jgi:hypothetical protein